MRKEEKEYHLMKTLHIFQNIEGISNLMLGKRLREEINSLYLMAFYDGIAFACLIFGIIYVVRNICF